MISESKSPRPGGPRAGVSIGADAPSPTLPRLKLQANSTARLRLDALLWAWRLEKSYVELG